jgi:glycosyltransferase involved in cell wall biosynthesis
MDQPETTKARISFKVSSFFSNSVIAVSESARKFYIENHFYNQKKLRVIYNCPGFKPMEHKPRIKEFSERSVIKLVNIGSLRVQKGQIFLIRAMKILQSSGLRFQLDIYGADRFGYGDTLHKEIRANNLCNVFVHDETKDVEKVMQQSDIFIASSIHEAFHMALLEALCVGLPSVATNIPPHQEILESMQAKVLVEPANAAAISEGVLRMILQKGLYTDFSKEALKRAEYFSLEKAVKKHYDLYSNSSM